LFGYDSHAHTMEVLGTKIDGESQVDMILHSLLNSFNQLRLNVLMNKNEYTLAKLMNELIAAENILKSKVIVNYACASCIGPKGSKKHLKLVGKPDVKKLKKVGKWAKGKNSGKCHHCDKLGHWKKECPRYLASIGQGNVSSFLVETCLVMNPPKTWCVDSGSTNHVCNSLQGLQVTRRLDEGEMYLTLGDGTKVPVHSIGIVKLCFNSKFLILSNCLYVPNIRRNLIFATYLGKHEYSIILRR
jgi:hypothetical protein